MLHWTSIALASSRFAPLIEKSSDTHLPTTHVSERCLHDIMPNIDTIEIRHYRLPLNPPFKASWDPKPRTSHTVTLVRVTAGEYEGVGSGDAMSWPAYRCGS